MYEIFKAWPPEQATGPIMLKAAYEAWQCVHGNNNSDILLINPGYVYVGDWSNLTAYDAFLEVCNLNDITSRLGQRRCLSAYPNAHVLTWWTHSWG